MGCRPELRVCQEEKVEGVPGCAFFTVATATNLLAATTSDAVFADASKRARLLQVHHLGDSSGANLESISHRCYLFEVAFVRKLTKETIVLPLGCLQGGTNDAVFGDTSKRARLLQVQGYLACQKLPTRRNLQ